MQLGDYIDLRDYVNIILIIAATFASFFIAYITFQAKDNNDKITGANISVKVTDNFMRAVEEDKGYLLYFNSHNHKEIKAKEYNC